MTGSQRNLIITGGILATLAIVAAVILVIRSAEAGRLKAAQESAHVYASNTLKGVLGAAAMIYKQEVRRDRDGDGVGEYGRLSDYFESELLDPATWTQRDGVVMRSHYGYHARLSSEPDQNEHALRILAFPIEGPPGLHPLLLDEQNQVWVGPEDYRPQQAIDLAQWRVWE